MGNPFETHAEHHDRAEMEYGGRGGWASQSAES